MKTLTNLILAFSIILLFSLTSCINDTEEINNSSENPITETVITEPSELKTEAKAEEIIEVENVEETEIERSSIKSQAKEIKREEVIVVKEEVKVIEKTDKEKLAKSIDLETDRNQNYNPDNANAPVELENDNSIELKPIFSESDLSKYYVIFKESHSKINRKEISKLVKTGQIVYIVNHQGIYKYCVGQSENENDAKVFKTKFDKEIGNTSSTVSTFSSAW